MVRLYRPILNGCWNWDEKLVRAGGWGELMDTRLCHARSLITRSASTILLRVSRL